MTQYIDYSDFDYPRGAGTVKLACRQNIYKGVAMLGDSLYLENIQEYVQDEDKIVRIL